MDTNENKVPDIKTEEKTEKKKNLFGSKKNSKPKEPKEPMEKKDIMCFVAAGVCFFLALFPYILRTLDASYDPDYNPFTDDGEEEKVEVVTNRLICSKTVDAVGYSYDLSIVNVYTNENISGSNLTYTINLNADSTYTLDDVILEDYGAITAIDSSAISVNIEDNIYTIKIDYNMDSTLRENTVLENHSKTFKEQMSNYTTLGYSCSEE